MIRDRRRCTWLLAGAVPTALALSACAGDEPITAPAQVDTGHASISTDVNPPTNPTILFEESFEDDAFASRGWYDFASTPTITDTTHIAGSAHALEARYPGGGTNPSWVLMRRLFASSPTVYVSYWVRYSANWVGSGKSYHPHEFLVLSDMDGDYTGLAESWMAAYVEHHYDNGGIPRIAIQDSKAINTSYGTPPIDLSGKTENRSVSGCNGVMEPNVVPDCFNMPPWYNAKTISAPQVWFQQTPGPGYKGNWNHVEAYFAANSIVNGIGQADGVAQYWFNGSLVIDRHDVTYRTGARPTISFHQFVIAPYIGDGAPVNQTMWVDNLMVATGRISSDSQPPPPPPATTNPGTVSDLAVAGVTDSSVTLSFTEVSDGAGLPASYFVRFAAPPIAWGSATDVTWGSCKVPMAGTVIGANRTCRVLGLQASTTYEFQLVAFRGTLNVDAVFGDLSDVASGTTAAKLVPLLP